MALPPGFLDELRARVPISQIVGRRVRWDARKSQPSKGDYWACCPFHEEKTPSFHVDDRRGFYHCFGCHAKGDAVTFLREIDNMGFMEAVETLAQAAGVAMPDQDPRAAARAAKAKGLADWMEAAVAFYRAELRGPRGAEARAYLERRGVTSATAQRFEIGYAAADRQALLRHLGDKGASPAEMAEAGLVATPEDGGAPYDRFRDRVMFPIRDARGRCVAFGGRALGQGAKAKYLNSPQTALFDKSRTLFNHGPGRAAAGKVGALVVVEGYMDVIGLAQVGLEHVVAPLGTAITEHHLEHLWRMAEAPVLALDGDAAGLNAAYRALDLALPLAAPDRTLRFALLPDGQDPDDLARAGGREAVDAAFAGAVGAVDLMWRRETEGRRLDDPDARAALEKRLRGVLARVADQTLRRHYDADLRARMRAAFRPPPPPPGRGAGAPGPRAAPPAAALPQTRASAVALDAGAARLERDILIALWRHPALLDRFADDLASVAFAAPALDALRQAMLTAYAAGNPPPDLSALRPEAAIGYCGAGVAEDAAAEALAFELRQAGLREAHSAEVAANATLFETQAEFDHAHVGALTQRVDDARRVTRGEGAADVEAAAFASARAAAESAMAARRRRR